MTASESEAALRLRDAVNASMKVAKETMLNQTMATTRIEFSTPINKLKEADALAWLAETRQKIELVESWLSSRPQRTPRK